MVRRPIDPRNSLGELQPCTACGWKLRRPYFGREQWKLAYLGFEATCLRCERIALVGPEVNEKSRVAHVKASVPRKPLGV